MVYTDTLRAFEYCRVGVEARRGLRGGVLFHLLGFKKIPTLYCTLGLRQGGPLLFLPPIYLYNS